MRFIIILLILPFISLHAKTLTIYSYGSFTSPYGPGPHLKEAFEKTCHCTVEFITMETSLLLSTRLFIEGKKTKADLVIGLDPMAMTPIKNLFKELHPYSNTCLAFIYKKDLIQNPPTSFRDFVESQPTVIVPDPRTSSTGLNLLAWMSYIFGSQNKEAWNELNVLTYPKGWGESYALFLRGESDYVLSYMTSPLYHALVEKNDAYGSLNFQEGNLCVHEYAGIPITSQHKELAQQFIDFLLSPEGDTIVATKGWRYPMGDIPDSWKKTPSFKIPLKKIDVENIPFDRKTLVNEWLEIAG